MGIRHARRDAMLRVSDAHCDGRYIRLYTRKLQLTVYHLVGAETRSIASLRARPYYRMLQLALYSTGDDTEQTGLRPLVKAELRLF
jgi:hypothetical protein